MGAITTTTFAEPIGYPNQQYIDRENYDGDLWFAKRVSQTQVDIYKSSNNGVSWTATGATFTRSNLQEISGLFMDSSGNCHIAYRVYESGQDKVICRRLLANTTTWEAEHTMQSITTGSAGSAMTGMDLVCFKLGTTWYVFVAIGITNGVNGGAWIVGGTYSSSNTYTNRPTIISGTTWWYNGPPGVVHPTLMFEHTGDGKTTNGSPALWMVWGRSTIYTARFTWAAGPTWVSPNTNTPPAVSSLSPNQPSNTAVYDAHGDRCLVAFPNGTSVRIAERSVDNTTQVQRDTPVHPAGGNVKHCALSVSSATSNMRVWAVATTNNKLYYVDYDRGADTWSAWTQVSAADIIGATFTNYSARRTNFGNGHFDLVITTGTSPYDLISSTSTAASTPHTPIISAPDNGVAQDVAAALPITWNFSDDDPSDFQQSYALRRTIGATVRYWNAGGSSWDVSEVFNSTGTTGVTLAASWGADSDASHFYAVRVKDQQGNSSNYSEQTRVIPSAKDNPTITSPTAAPTSSQITVSWTVASQTAYRVLLTKLGVTIRDTGWVTSTDTSVLLPDQLLAQAYVVTVTTRNDEGLTSDAVQQAFTPNYTPPQAATPSFTALSSSGLIRVSVANPDPVGAESYYSNNKIYRRKVGDTGTGTPIAIIAPSGPSNILAPYNPGFEAVNSSNNWGTANGAVSTAARTTLEFHSGIASFMETAVSGAGFAGINFGPLNTFAALPGQVWFCSFWFKALAGMAVRGQIGWRTAANTSNGTPTTGATLTATGAWQEYTMVSNAAPSNTAFAFPSLGQSATANVAGDKLYVDDAVFYKVGSSSGTPSTYDDFEAASNTAYEYSIVTTAVNGATTQSGWFS